MTNFNNLVLVDRFFIQKTSSDNRQEKDKFLDTKGKFTQTSPFDDNVYVATTEAEAKDHLKSLNLPNNAAAVQTIQRFVPKK